MASHDLLFRFQKDLSVEDHWRLNGMHYQKTADAWLSNLDSRRDQVLPIVAATYGPNQAERWLQRWRIFFSCLLRTVGYADGEEWLVSHYRLKK